MRFRKNQPVGSIAMLSSLILSTFLHKQLLTFYKFNESCVFFPPAALSPVLHLSTVRNNADNLIVPKQQHFTGVKGGLL